MIVQDNPAGGARFCMTMEQHTAFADRLAAVFGNEVFAAVEDESVRYVIAHHDAGWRPVDALVLINPETGLPYHLTQTPFEYTSKTMRGSPKFNGEHSALAGLLSSMHTAGLLNGQYGKSPPGILGRLQGDIKAFAEKVLEEQLAYQEEKRPELGIDDNTLWTAYKQLQFFDTLSLYFHCKAEGERGETDVHNVPTRAGDDVTITVIEREPGVYAAAPFPFNADGVEVYFEGRWLEPQDPAIDGPKLYDDTPVSRQTVRFVTG
jgi:hypothetical protein